MSEPGILEQAGVLARAGRMVEAVRLILDAADRGIAEAQLEVAQWRLFGMHGPRDPARAMQLLEQARTNGFIPAARLEAVLIGNGAAADPDPERALRLLEAAAPLDPDAARQIAMLSAMPRPEGAVALPVEVLCENPVVRVVRGLISPAEAEYLIEKATPRLEPSFVIDPSSGRRMPHPVRTSSGTNFGPMEEDLVIHAINRRIAAASGTDVRCGEMLHILRYGPGEQYRPHLDALPGVANQRCWTALLYLNDRYEGGETHFSELGIAFRGRTGDALIFRNIAGDGEAADSRTRHAGVPVTQGFKWIASRWIRQSPFSPWHP